MSFNLDSTFVIRIFPFPKRPAADIGHRQLCLLNAGKLVATLCDGKMEDLVQKSIPTYIKLNKLLCKELGATLKENLRLKGEKRKLSYLVESWEENGSYIFYKLPFSDCTMQLPEFSAAVKMLTMSTLLHLAKLGQSCYVNNR